MRSHGSVLSYVKAPQRRVRQAPPPHIVTLGLDPRVHFSVWAPQWVDPRNKSGDDEERVTREKKNARD